MHQKTITFSLLLLIFLPLAIIPVFAQTPQTTLPQIDTLRFPSHEEQMHGQQSGPDTLDVIDEPPVVQTTRQPVSTTPAGPKDLPRSAIPWFSEQQLQNPFNLQPSYADTTLLNFHHYDYAATRSRFYAHKGNPGHAHRQLTFNPDLSTGIQLGEKMLYGHYLFSHENLRFYRPKYVYTDLFYVMGAEREQLFYGMHAQKLHETFHYSFQYRVINSPGSFSRLGARNTNFYVTADYLSPNKRYQALGSLVTNRMRNMESGGLKNPAGYEQDPDSDSVFVYRSESRFSNMSVNLRHFYQTGFYLGADTTGNERFINLGRINHDFTWQRTTFVFQETGEAFPWYNTPFTDPQSTFDSTTVNRITNQVSWANFPLENQRMSIPFNFKVYLQHSINNIQQPWLPEGAPLRDTTEQRIYYYTGNRYTQLVNGIELESDRNRLISFGGFANLTTGGYNDEDFHAGAFLNLGAEGKKYNLEGMLRFSSMEAPYFYRYFSSNNIGWENEFSKMQIANLRARLNTPWIKVEGNYYQMENMVYFNRNALPVQNTSSFGLFSLALGSDLELGFLGLRNHVLLQQATTAQFENFPDLVSYHSLYFKFPLSQGALWNHMGIDFHFNPGYRAMAWMPVSRVFFAQDAFEVRDRYLVDVFWSGKIKSARLFVKYQNILGLIPDFKPRYEIPFYPIPESMFKFGVSWMFFD